jgi:RNA polymerase sigma-70 factor (ECF subfamily)
MQSHELFDRCKQNDPRAQRALYDHYKNRLMGLCRRYARSREDAQDMLQESFIKIFTKIKQVESEQKLEGWMKSVAVHTAIDHYHKLKKHDQPSYSSTEYEVPGIDYDLVLDQLGDEYLVKLINELPEGARMVFNLFEVEGYSHAEIATLLGISEGTSRSQLHHAKLLLKQKLNTLGVKRYEKLA